jgi:Fungal specific transcription factor domain
LVLLTEINRADLVGCIESDSPPRFQFFDVDIYHSTTKRHNGELGEGFRNILQIFAFDSELSSIIHDLQLLTDLFIELTTTRTSADRRELDHSAASLRHRLLSCHSARKTTTPQDLISESCRLSALIYLRTILPGYPSRDWVYATLIEKLKSCIDGINLSGFASNGIVGELMLWVLFISSIVDLGPANRLWFVVRIAKVASALQLQGWSHVKKVLMKFLWVEQMHEYPCSVLWNEVIAMESL